MASFLSPLGVLVLEREPLRFADSDVLLKNWVQVAGGFAAIGLIIYILHTIYARRGGGGMISSRLFTLVLILAAVAALCYLPAFGLGIYDAYDNPPPKLDPSQRLDQKLPPRPLSPIGQWHDWLLTIGGSIALFAFCLPFAADMMEVRLRRIWAVAKLSFVEAIRRKVLWVFLAFLLIFLFPPKWFFPIKVEDEVRTNISVIYWTMTPLLLVTAGLLAAFAIPGDIRNQTIHTIVTKPVERFEIVLGRFFGYVMLFTLILGFLTVISLGLIRLGNVSEEAQSESLKARVPVYGALEFRGGDVNFKGESVGREWDYRRYIAGGPNSPQRAIWVFRDGELPANLAARSEVPVEFSFDIFRTTKGEVENKGVFVTFTITTFHWGDPLRPDTEKVRRYQDAVRGLNLNAQPGDPDWAKLDALAEEFGFYEFRSKEIVDYHTFDIVIPGGIFRSALKGTPPPDFPRLFVIVKCDSRTQYLGVAKHDLYLLSSDSGFAWNFVKGAYGLWLRVCIVIGLAVACSTYLSGVISLLVTFFLFVAGFRQDFIQTLADGTNVGGGPFESFLRLARGQNLTINLEPSAGTTAAVFSDARTQWVYRRLLDIIPDVDRLNWSNYVAEGFNIGGADLVLSTLVVLGYLLPWAVVAHYLMKSREIAS